MAASGSFGHTAPDSNQGAGLEVRLISLSGPLPLTYLYSTTKWGMSFKTREPSVSNGDWDEPLAS